MKSKKGTSFKFNLQGVAERWQEEELQSQKIRFDDNNSLEIDEYAGRIDNKYYVDVGFDVESNGKKAYILNDFSLSGQFRRYTEDILSESRNNQIYTMPSFRVINNLNFTYRIGDNRALAVCNNTKAVVNNHRFVLNGTMEQNASYADVTNVTAMSLKLSKGAWVLSFDGNIELGYYRRKTDMENVLPEYAAALGDSVENRLDAFFVNPKISAYSHYEWKSVEVEALLPLSIPYYRVRDNGIWTDKFLPALSPQITATWKVSRFFKAILSGNYSLTSGSIDDMMSGFILKNYRFATSSEVIPERHRWNVRMELNWAIINSRLAFNLRGGYGEGNANTSFSSYYYDDLTISRMIGALSTDKSVFAGAKLQKWFGTHGLMMSIDAEYRVDWKSMYLQGIENDYATEYWTAGLDMSYNPARYIGLAVDFDYCRSAVLNYESTPTHSFRTEAKVVVTPVKPFSIITSVFHLHQIVADNTFSNTPMLKIGAEYRFKNVRLFFDCLNLLDSKEYSREILNNFMELKNSFSLRPRSYIVGVRMSL